MAKQKKEKFLDSVRLRYHYTHHEDSLAWSHHFPDRNPQIRFEGSRYHGPATEVYQHDRGNKEMRFWHTRRRLWDRIESYSGGPGSLTTPLATTDSAPDLVSVLAAKSYLDTWRTRRNNRQNQDGKDLYTAQDTGLPMDPVLAECGRRWDKDLEQMHEDCERLEAVIEEDEEAMRKHSDPKDRSQLDRQLGRNGLVQSALLKDYVPYSDSDDDPSDD